MSIVSALVVMVILIPTERFLLSLFIDTKEFGAAQSLETAHHYYLIMLFNLVFLYLIYAYRCPLQGIGNSFWSMVSGITETVVRIVMAKVIFGFLGAETLFYIEPAAWMGALIAAMLPCYSHIRKLPHSDS